MPATLNLYLIEEQMEIIHTSEQQNLKMNWAHGGIHLAGHLLFSLLVAFQGKVHIVRHLHTVGIKLCYARKKKKGGCGGRTLGTGEWKSIRAPDIIAVSFSRNNCMLSALLNNA